MLRTRDGWTVGFDAVYNKAAALKHVDRAGQFLRAAKESEARGDLDAAVDALWGAAELAAKARLLTQPYPDVAKTKTHGRIKSRYNMEVKRENIPSQYAKTLNRLSDRRPFARFVGDAESMTADEFAQHASVVEQMLEDGRRIASLPPVEGRGSGT